MELMRCPPWCGKSNEGRKRSKQKERVRVSQMVTYLFVIAKLGFKYSLEAKFRE